MATELFARLQVEGGDNLRNLLDRLGTAGQAAFKALTDAAERSRPALARVEAAFQQLRASAAITADGFGQVGRGFGALDRGLVAVGNSVQRNAQRIRRAVLLVTTAVTAATTAAALWATKAADAAVDADKQGRLLGLSARQYQIWTRIVESADGAATDLQSGLEHLNSLVARAVSGDRAAAAALRGLGIALTDSTGRLRSTHELLGDVVALFARLRAGEQARIAARGYVEAADLVEFAGRRAAAATLLFGDAGRALIPTFNQSAAAINAQAAQLDRLGVTFNTWAVRAAQRFRAGMNEAKLGVEGLKNEIGILVAEAAEPLLGRFNSALQQNRSAIIAWAQDAIIWTEAFVADLGRLFRGEDASAANAWLNTARAEVMKFAEDLQRAWRAVTAAHDLLMAGLDRVAAAFNAVFGTDLTGRVILLTLIVGRLLNLFQLIGPLLMLAGGALRTIWGLLGLVTGAARLLWAGLNLAAAAFGVKGLLGAATSFVRGAIVGLRLLAVVLEGAFLGTVLKVASSALAALAGFIGWPALVIAGLVALGAAFVIFWDDIVAGASKAWDWLKRVVGWIASVYDSVTTFVGVLFGGPAGTAAAAVQEKQAGGLITGGSGLRDDVPLLAQGGEFMIRKSSVQRIVRRFGLGFLHALNAGFVPRFAAGGLVGGLEPSLTQAGMQMDMVFAAAGGRPGTGATVNLYLRDGTRVPMWTEDTSVLVNSDTFALSPPNRWARR